MRILVNHSEDRQNRVVELAHKLLLEQFDALQALNLPTPQAHIHRLIKRSQY